MKALKPAGHSTRAFGAGRSLGLGRLLYRTWYRPLEIISQSRREGGPIQQWKTRRAAAEMAACAHTLRPDRTPFPEKFTVHLLSGHRYWAQTLFCLYSLQQNADAEIRPVVHDDGSITAADAEIFTQIFPGGEIQPARLAQERVNRLLPPEKFPALHGQWQTYPHLRKIIDVHLGESGWKLVMDSDLLFFRRPEALLGWLRQPVAPFHILDIKTSYGYSRAVLEQISGGIVPERVNVGLIGLRSDDIDWAELEAWTATLLREHGSSYYLEQALSALLVGKKNPIVGSEADYRIWPSPEEIRNPTAAMHHYVDLSKVGYFREAWRSVAKKPPAA